MKKYLIPLLLISALMISCGDKNVDLVENLGDELLDSILSVESDIENRMVRYTYKWDDKSRLSYITYANEFSDNYGRVEISYVSDFIVYVQYNKNFSDSWGTYTIFHDGIKVDSLYHHAGYYVIEGFDETSRFTHLDDMIIEESFKVYQYSKDSSTSTIIWNLTKNGNIESIRDVDFTYDNKRNPLANSFYNYNGVSPILRQNNIISYRTSAGNERTTIFEYLKNDLPKHRLNGDGVITSKYYY